MKRILLITLLLITMWSAQAKTTYYVKQGATGTGTSWADASGDIQAMINISAIGDEVWVATGIYYPTQAVNDATDPRDRSFVMKEGVSVYGGFQGIETSVDKRQWADPTRANEIGYCEFKYPTILNGDLGNDDEWIYDTSTKQWTVNYNRENAYCVVYYNPTTTHNYELIFDGFTVKGGNNTKGTGIGAGGIYFGVKSVRDETTNWETIYYSMGKIKNCTVSNCSGGGVIIKGNVNNCFVNSNLGGGLWIRGNANKCKINKNNNAGQGGGITIWAGSVVDSCNISDNYAGGSGGGFYIDFDGIIKNSDIHDNTSQQGGGGYVSDHGTGTVTKCRLYSNKCMMTGGGCYLSGGRADKCLIFNNLALVQGGGVSTWTGTITNCVIFNNSGINRGASAICFVELSGDMQYATNCILFNNNKDDDYEFYDWNSGENLGSNSILGSIMPNSILGTIRVKGQGDEFNVNMEDIKFIRPSTFVGLATSDAQLQELLNTDWHIQAGSVCIDRGLLFGPVNIGGTLIYSPTTDMDGEPRPMGSAVDIGVDEYFNALPLPFTENFETNTMKFFTINPWIIKSLNNSYQGYYAGTEGVTNYNHELFTAYFVSPSNRKVTLSYDLTFKSANKNTLEQMAVVLLPMGATKADTIYIHNNQSGSFTGSHFSFNHYLPNGTQCFQLKFIAKGINAYNIYYWALDNVNLSENTKVDYTVTALTNQSIYGTVSGNGLYEEGSNCTLTATPNTGYSFTNWTENGSVVSSSASYSFTVTGNRTLVANFIPINYTVLVSANPVAGGTVSGGGEFLSGTTHTVTATPNAGYLFSNWTENGTVISTSPSYTFTLNGNRTLIANFAVDNTTYNISLQANPIAGGVATGEGTFNSGTSTTISATANTGYSFVNWTENGNIVSTSANYTFTVSKNRTLVANFASVKHTISISVNPDYYLFLGYVTISGAGVYDYGSKITSTAAVTSANKMDFGFKYWTENGQIVETEPNYIFTADRDYNLVANFTSLFNTNNISASVNPLNSGTVWGASRYDNGDICTLKATPNIGYVFTNWTENGTILSTSPNYVFTVNGSRILLANFKLNTGIPDVSAEKINVYSSQMSVFIEKGEGWNISLFNSLGKKVLENKISSSKFEVPLKSNGLYVVLLTKDGKSCSRKVIVSK